MNDPLIEQITSDLVAAQDLIACGNGDFTPARLRELFAGAVLVIGRLQRQMAEMKAVAGAVSNGPSYADIAKDARHEVPVTDTQTPRTDG